jgi:ribonucleoside-diphosphate reductase alpha chain
MREELPNKRRSVTQRLKVNGQTVHFSVGLYPDGRPGEVFIDISRTGTAVRAWYEATAKLLSLMLQHGVPVSELVQSLAGHCTEPFGRVPVSGHECISDASGVLDAIVRSMALDFLATEADRRIENLVAAVAETESLGVAELRDAIDELGATEMFEDFLSKFGVVE